MLNSVSKALVKHPKQESFYKKNDVIIICSKVTLYISKTKLLFMDILTNAPMTLVNKTHI